MGYQSEAELEERLMTKLESQGYERMQKPSTMSSQMPNSSV